MRVLSPLTKTYNTKFIESIPSELVIRIYHEDFGLDVSKYFHADKVEIYKCLDTNFRFYYPFDLEGDEGLYRQLQLLGSYYSIWNWEHTKVFNIIKSDNNVLEIGCGSGNFLKSLKQANIKNTGLELNEMAVAVCHEQKLNVRKEYLNEHIKANSNVYDVVCSFQVLEHVKNPRDFIIECIQAAKVGGKIIFGVPNNNPYLFKRDKYHTLNLPPHHMGLWSKDSLSNLPKHFQLKILNIELEPLQNKRYYFNLIFDAHRKLHPLKNLSKKISSGTIDFLAKLNRWQGRNIVAIFEKI